MSRTGSGRTRNDRAMKVGLVSPYDFASPGGVNDHVRHLAVQLQQLGHETRIFAPSSRADVDFDSARFYRIGTPIAIPVNDSVARITLSFHLANQVAAIVADEGFDVLHFHEPLMPALPITMLRMSNTANVGTFHAFARSNVGYFYGRPLLQPYLEHLHRAIAVSEPARAFVQRYFPAFPMRVIPNGVDVSVYRPGLAPIRHLRDECLNVLFVGRLEKRKGLGDLLRAYRAMSMRIPQTRLIIVGDGPLRGRVESYVARHRLPNVVVAGYVPDSVKPRYYNSADIFCAPATGAESFGIVLLEALASGLPVVATEVPGYMSVLESGRDSVTVQPKNWRELAASLVILARDAELRRRLSDYAIQKARRYSWELVASEVIEVYQEARKALAARPAATLEVTGVHHAV
ncbi:MAG: glycosyltransferase family 4 protein [Chloroflexi bacterium]|nr:MAG: glycosyltransferase family 4 protein [Chloroflexota bacterium]TMG20941.1 MAG: glycosyltransferase family 4 protein [Chloroflexota bacterium]TMG67607.1 MAG: glycosyltransferase family 4 protein [Chloroflexota bacterium]